MGKENIVSWERRCNIQRNGSPKFIKPDRDYTYPADWHQTEILSVPNQNGKAQSKFKPGLILQESEIILSASKLHIQRQIRFKDYV